MAAKITDVIKTGPRAWRYEWTGTSPYTLYSPDVVTPTLTTTNASWLAEWNDIEHTPDALEPPIVEVIDSTQTTGDVQTLQYPNMMRMQARRSDSQTNAIVVQNLVGSTWIDRQLIGDDIRPGYFSYLTTGLTDGTTHTFRWVPIDFGDPLAGIGETTGQALVFGLDWVTLPSAPSITGTYTTSSTHIGGTITISAR